MTHDITANICFHGNYQTAVELNISNGSRSFADLRKKELRKPCLVKRSSLPYSLYPTPHPLRGDGDGAMSQIVSSYTTALVRDKGSCCCRQRPLPAQDGSLASDNIFGIPHHRADETRYYLERRCGINHQ